MCDISELNSILENLVILEYGLIQLPSFSLSAVLLLCFQSPSLQRNLLCNPLVVAMATGRLAVTDTN